MLLSTTEESSRLPRPGCDRTRSGDSLDVGSHDSEGFVDDCRLDHRDAPVEARPFLAVAHRAAQATDSTASRAAWESVPVTDPNIGQPRLAQRGTSRSCGSRNPPEAQKSFEWESTRQVIPPADARATASVMGILVRFIAIAHALASWVVNHRCRMKPGARQDTSVQLITRTRSGSLTLHSRSEMVVAAGRRSPRATVRRKLHAHFSRARDGGANATHSCRRHTS